MWLIYSTLGEVDAAENALYLGELPSKPRWADIRRRAGGLIRKEEPCFVWNGEAFDCVASDAQLLSDVVPYGADVVQIKLVPLNGTALPVRKTQQLEGQSTVRSKTSASSLTTSAISAMVPPFDAKATEKVLSDVADTAKKVSSLMGATLSSWTKSATETIKEAAVVEKKFEQIGPVKLRIGKKIAEGGFSEVFIAKGPNDERYAVKRCRAQTAEQLVQLRREIAAHASTDDVEHILKLFASDIVPGEGRGSIVRFVFPLCEGGSWFDCFTKYSTEEETLRIFLGAAKGLQALHAKDILHRDVKPHNVLLTADGFPLLMDLGSSCPLPIRIATKGAAALLAEDAAENCSAPYRAPELWEPKVGKNIGGEADVWSLGCSLYAVTYGKGYSPYEDAVQGVLKLAILNLSQPKFPPGPYSDFCKGVIMRTLTAPSSRITLDDLITEVEKRLA